MPSGFMQNSSRKVSYCFFREILFGGIPAPCNAFVREEGNLNFTVEMMG
jgi:hypothetical protein